MATTILDQYGTETALAFGASNSDLDSLPDGDACICTEVNIDQGTADTPPRVLIAYDLNVSNASAPDDNSLIEFYLLRKTANVRTAADDGTVNDGANEQFAGPSDDVDTIKFCGEFVHAQPVVNTLGRQYAGAFVVEDPGEDWSLAVVNETGQSLHSANNDVYYTTIIPESQ